MHKCFLSKEKSDQFTGIVWICSVECQVKRLRPILSAEIHHMSVCVSWPEIEFCCYCSVFVLRYFWKCVLCFFIFVLVYKAISLSVFNDSWTLACFCTRCALIWGLHNMLFTCCQLVLKVLKPNDTLTAFICEFVRFLDAYHRTSGSDS